MSHLATDLGARADDIINNTTEGVSSGLRKRSHELQERATQARDATEAWVQHEPLKAVLLAATAGAVFMAVATLLSRRWTR